MKKNRQNFYWLFGIVLFVIDRAMKVWALHNLSEPLRVNQWCSLELMLNRGISLGLFHFDNRVGFFAISLLVFAILFFISVWTLRVYRRGEKIIGQTLIIVGGVSNILDRILYGGVIDFIVLTYNNWHLPVFNGADLLIDVGVFILVLQGMRKK